MFLNVRIGSAIPPIIAANHNFNTKYITQPMSGSIKKTLGVIDDRAFYPDTMPANKENEDIMLIALLSNDSVIHSCATKTPIIPATNVISNSLMIRVRSALALFLLHMSQMGISQYDKQFTHRPLPQSIHWAAAGAS